MDMHEVEGASASSAQVGRTWQRAFFTVWAGQAFSLLGSGLVQFALVWWMTKTTGSATILAISTLVAMLPEVFVNPFAGALVDRWSRKWIIIIADASMALVTLGLIGIYLTGNLQVWHIYLAIFLRSVGSAFHWSAWQASTSLMVPHDQLARVAGMTQSLHGIIGIAAPPLGALLMELVPLSGVLATDVITALIAVACLVPMHIPQPTPVSGAVAPAGQGAAAMLADVREGFRYIWRWPGLRGVVLAATLINFFFMPALVLVPILVTGQFSGGALQLSWMQSAFGFGTVAGGLLLSVWGGFRRRIYTSLGGLILCGLAIFGIGLTPAGLLGLAMAGMFMVGAMLPMINGPFMAIVQSTVEPAVQGRVFAVIGSLVGAMSPVAMLIAGPAADLLGVRMWYYVGGLGCLGVALACFLVSDVLNIETNHRQPAAPQAAGPADGPEAHRVAVEQLAD